MARKLGKFSSHLAFPVDSFANDFYPDRLDAEDDDVIEANSESLSPTHPFTIHPVVASDFNDHVLRYHIIGDS